MASKAAPLPDPYSREMPGWDMPHGDYNVTNVNYKDFKICEKSCDDDGKCKGWTYVIRGPLYASCCLKANIKPAKKKSTCTSGVKDPSGDDIQGSQFFVDYKPPANGESETKVIVGAVGGKTDTLKLLSSDETIDMQLFVDNTFTEVYWMSGRVAMTTTTDATAAADVTVSADISGTTLAYAKAWKVGSIWVTPEEVLRTPRLDATVSV